MKNYTPNHKFKMCIVVPVYGELKTLPVMLKSLQNNDNKLLDITAIICVINNPPRENADPEKIHENDILMSQLKKSIPPFDIKNLFFIDASSKGKEILPKYGVGGARKTGMDFAFSLIKNRDTGILISLDADCTVSKNYLSEINKTFKQKPDIAGAVIDFEHMLTGDHKIDRAIKEYEAFIRHYVNGLRYAGSPYAYHSIGSTIVAKADAYKKCGGMRPKPAGEDFYFLQALRKIGKIEYIKNAKVFPSARISDRVPFGTGPAIRDICSGKPQKFYNPAIFVLLKSLFDILNDITLEELLLLPDIFAKRAPREINEFLVLCHFTSQWNKIIKNTPKDLPHLKHAFHVWFDAFRTLKFIHFCRDNFPHKYPSLNHNNVK